MQKQFLLSKVQLVLENIACGQVDLGNRDSQLHKFQSNIRGTSAHNLHLICVGHVAR